MPLVSYITTAIFFLLLAVYCLILIAYVGNINIPGVNKLIRKKYLQVRFKIWDDIKEIEEAHQTQNETKLSTKIKFSWHKAQTTSLYFLALLFKSPRQSFVLLNCDNKERNCEEDEYPEHLTKKRKAT